MIIFFATAVFLAVIGLRREDGAEREYMSVNMTNSIRGFFSAFGIYQPYFWLS